MPQYVKPERFLEVFTCPFCDVTAKQNWYGNNTAKKLFFRKEDDDTITPIFGGDYVIHDKSTEYSNWIFSKCQNCNKITVWHEEKMVYPDSFPVDSPNEDMPDSIKSKYIEAAKVVSLSPASAAALLRLALQILLKEILGEDSSGNIYKDILILKEKPIDSSLIQALDIIRIAGNESVHPGELNLSENEDDALLLFDLLNMICDQFFTQPNRMKKMYEKLPKSKRILDTQSS